jgi:predicted MPP superfamily phosphohydrolase
MFRLVFLSFLLGFHGYIAARFVGPLPWAPALKWALAAGVLGIAALYPIAMRLRWEKNAKGPWIDRLMFFTYTMMGTTALLIVLSVLRDVGWVLALIGGALPDDPSARDALLVQVNLGVLGVTTAGALFGLTEARRTPRVKRVTVPIAGLPEALSGYSIAHITDLHIGTTIKRDFVDAVVRTTNGLDADAIALTGDFIDGSVDELREHAAPLSELRARDGSFFVTGNHEYYSGAEQWVEHFEALGIRVLLNEHEVVERDGAQLVIAGVCDYSAGQFLAHHRSDPHGAVADAPDGAPRVLLAHQPRTAKLAEGAGYALQLSGHTHGGQLWPWNFVVPLQQPTVAGLDVVGDTQVYTSRGTGFWGPPMRVGAPSEIALLTLVPA